MVAIGAVAYMMMGRGGVETPPAPVTTAPEPAPVEPAGPTPEELEAQQLAEAEASAAEQAALESQIASIVDAKTKEREAELEQLKADLAAAKQRESDAAKERERLAAIAAQQEQAAAEQAAAEQAAAEQAAAEQAAAEKAAAEETARLAEAQKPPVEVKPKAPEVKTGDLVTLAPGVVPPKYISMRPVTYPAMARRLRKESTVTVRCLVDENGNVADTQLKGKEVGFGMDSEALAAAKTARFNPATKNGVRVKIWWDVPIKFQL
jgi:TonB family protein